MANTSENIKIALIFADGTVGIMSFVVKDGYGYEARPTDENIYAEILKVYPSLEVSKKPIQSWHRISDEDIPQDRTFRNAWRHDGKKFGIDMNHAKEIHKDYIRELRSPILSDLDTQYMRADESGDSKKMAEIVQKKNLLRDATKHPDISNAKTPEELKNAIPPVLKEK